MKAFLTNSFGEDDDDDNEGYFQECASDVVFGGAQLGNDCWQFYSLCKGDDDDDDDDDNVISRQLTLAGGSRHNNMPSPY